MSLNFKSLYQYNAAMNKKVLHAALSNTEKLSDKCKTLISHGLAAHHIWNVRILEQTALYTVWDLIDSNKWLSLDESNHEQTAEILADCKLSDVFHYTNTKNIQYKNKVEDILFHVINHSTYHRAQIATEFKACGLSPIASDYIAYKR
jgi:uncharacterized damage-inducible protein DinB